MARPKNEYFVVSMDTKIGTWTDDPKTLLKSWILGQGGDSEEIGWWEGEPVTKGNFNTRFEAMTVEDLLCETIFPDFVVADRAAEGEEGIGIGFSSADRDYIIFPWPAPEGDFTGNGDPLVFKTKGVAKNLIILGEEL